jgi:hypothetical protein
VRTTAASQDTALGDWDSFLWQMPAQNWLAPANLPWDDWTGRMQDATISASL